MAMTIQFKRGTSARWEELNPILAEGEPGYDLDKGRIKIGNGITPWSELPFQDEHAVVSKDTIYEFPSYGKVNTIYYVQLGINALWSLLFFRLRLFAFSSIWLALLIAAVSYMIYEFYKLDKTAGLIQIPYLLWLGFAFLLNYSIYLLNR